MDQGRIVQDGTPEQVYERPVNRFVADFLGVSNRISVTAVEGPRVRGPFGELLLSETPPWSAGTLAVRMEDIEVREAAPAVNGFPALVEERLFRGDHWELRVRVAGTALSVMTNPDQIHHEGQSVWIELPPDYLVPLAD
jgi:spermidine/putrescine transport system ATP-binding protein